MRGTFRSLARAALAGLAGLSVLALADIRPAAAQSPASDSAPSLSPSAAPSLSWADPELVRAARAEAGTLTVYSSVNEQEALPFWKLFEDATGIKVGYVRGSDVQILSRSLARQVFCPRFAAPLACPDVAGQEIIDRHGAPFRNTT